jgi:hypothetical protein
MSYSRPDSGLRPGEASPQPAAPRDIWQTGEVARRAPRNLPLARRYEIEWLTPEGDTKSRVEIAAALPAFEEAFSAFAHGVPILTTEGEVAVEDLLPGMTLICGNGAETRLLWKGAITLVPGAPSASGESPRLTRVTADSFGPGRPARDLLFGPAARRLVRGTEVRARCGCEAALQRLDADVDGDVVIALSPVQPVRVYHLMAEGHATILAGGVEVETYHPAPDHALSLSAEMRTVFLSLFPHLDRATGFGRTLWPRLAEAEDVA